MNTDALKAWRRDRREKILCDVLWGVIGYAAIFFAIFLTQGCIPPQAPPTSEQGLYAAELAACVAKAENRSDSRFCRAAVDCKYRQPTCKDLR